MNKQIEKAIKQYIKSISPPELKFFMTYKDKYFITNGYSIIFVPENKKLNIKTLSEKESLNAEIYFKVEKLKEVEINKNFNDEIYELESDYEKVSFNSKYLKNLCDITHNKKIRYMLENDRKFNRLMFFEGNEAVGMLLPLLKG